MWLDRKNELKTFEDIASSGRAEFLVLYGRRRVGKSELLEHFIAARRGVRLLAREESVHLQLGHFSRALADYFNDSVLAANHFNNWDAFFTYLAGKSHEPLVVALDEYPYLATADPSISSILQYHWDTHLRNTKIFLILCGSSIGMMEDIMGGRSPLYGRRTSQILLKPFRFTDIFHWFGGVKKAVEAYAVFGGTPAYILDYVREKSLWANIRDRILNRERFLFKDTEFILREEVREPRAYFSILASIAEGNTTIGKIVNHTGLGKGVVGKYIGVLSDLQLVEREVPVSESQPHKSRKGIYRLSDNFFRFWFRFVHPNIQFIEQGKQDWLVRNVIRPHLSTFIGGAFEGITREILADMERKKLLPFELIRLNRWWSKTSEIDLVGIGEKAVLLCEVKWSDHVDAVKIVRELVKKSGEAGFSQPKKFYCVFARSFKRRAEGSLNIDLEYLERTLG